MINIQADPITQKRIFDIIEEKFPSHLKSMFENSGLKILYTNEDFTKLPEVEAEILADPMTAKARKQYSDPEQPDTIAGMQLPWTNVLLLNAKLTSGHELPATLVHELGHVIDHAYALKKPDVTPKAYEELNRNIPGERKYAESILSYSAPLHLQDRMPTISGYDTGNPKETFAEGVRMYTNTVDTGRMMDIFNAYVSKGSLQSVLDQTYPELYVAIDKIFRGQIEPGDNPWL